MASLSGSSVLAKSRLLISRFCDRVKSCGMLTFNTDISFPNRGSPKRTAGPILWSPTGRQTSAGRPLGSNSPVLGFAPLGRSMATTVFAEFLTIWKYDEIGSSIGLEILKPKTPSRIKFDLLHKFAKSLCARGPVMKKTFPPADANCSRSGSSLSRGIRRANFASNPALTRYVAATIASPPLLPLPTKAKTSESSACLTR